MKNLSKIALGAALGAALMFATKPGPSFSDWQRYGGMGHIACDDTGHGVIQNIFFDRMKSLSGVSIACR